MENKGNYKAKVKDVASTGKIKSSTKTKVDWDGTSWKVKQHIPWAADWDDTTKTYSSPPKSFVKLP